MGLRRGGTLVNKKRADDLYEMVKSINISTEDDEPTVMHKVKSNLEGLEDDPDVLRIIV